VVVLAVELAHQPAEFQPIREPQHKPHLMVALAMETLVAMDTALFRVMTSSRVAAVEVLVKLVKMRHRPHQELALMEETELNLLLLGLQLIMQVVVVDTAIKAQQEQLVV
jgi:hypothetical protein